jgi:hypothetical protein
MLIVSYCESIKEPVMLIVEYPWDVILWLNPRISLLGKSHNPASDVNDPKIIQLPSSAVGLARCTLV